MRIGLIGGTGDIGEGLALRWGYDTDHTILIGSRKKDKAKKVTEQYISKLSGTASDSFDLRAVTNRQAADLADIIILCLPPDYIISTVEQFTDVFDEDDIIVSPAVQMDRDEHGFHYDPLDDGSVAEAINQTLNDGMSVVGAFQNIAAGALADLDHDLSADIIVTGNDPEAKDQIMSLAEAISGVRALDGGPIETTQLVEGLTPLLINLAMYNDELHDLNTQFN